MPCWSTSGPALQEAGHGVQVVDLYAIEFGPVFRTRDMASYLHEDMPPDILEGMNLKQRVLDSLRNQWLIAIECHARGITPTYVAGFRAFLDLNRCVRKGEKAIRILAKRALLRLMRSRVIAASVLRGDARADAWLWVERKSSGVCGMGS